MRVIQDWIDATKQFRGFQFHIKSFGMFTLRRMSFGNLPYAVKQLLQTSNGSSQQLSRTTPITWDMLGASAKKLLWQEFNEKNNKVE